MNFITTRASANLRGIIIVAAAMVAAALSDQTLRLMVQPWAWSGLGILGVGLTTWRAFLDNSNARANAAAQSTTAPAPVVVENGPASPVPVSEAGTLELQPTPDTATAP